MRIKDLGKRVRASRNLSYGAVAIATLGVFTLGVLTGDGKLHLQHGYDDATGLPTTLDMSSLNQVYQTLRENYDGKLTQSQVIDGLKHGLAESTGDPYTEYFTAKEAKAFNTDLQGISLTGIGAQLDQDAQGDVVVMSPIAGSPAQAAGLQAKDIILSIDGQSTAGMSVGTAVTKIRGTKGTKVTLVVLRGEEQKSFTITRDAISVPTATGKILDDGIGYLQVSQFSDDTYDLVKQQVSKFQAAGVKKVILDLRDNPGGEVTSAQDIASLWLPNKTLIEQEKRGNDVVDSLHSNGTDPLHGMPTVVLMNAGSASASEITALALHDNKAATILGEKSYGKGVVQAVVPFSDGSELKVTVAKWYSPSGKNINHIGITPDQTVKAGNDPANDNQLQAAEDFLNK
jgi:carboxyl-terminal processing protease